MDSTLTDARCLVAYQDILDSAKFVYQYLSLRGLKCLLSFDEIQFSSPNDSDTAMRMMKELAPWRISLRINGKGLLEVSNQNFHVRAGFKHHHLSREDFWPEKMAKDLRVPIRESIKVTMTYQSSC